jgi:hypothetical protein
MGMHWQFYEAIFQGVVCGVLDVSMGEDHRLGKCVYGNYVTLPKT